MSDKTLISYAQNGEDVVLWRALRHVEQGRYVDVGGWDPDIDSVTRLLHDRGWRGIDVEPVPEFAEKFRRRRPDNEVVEAVITDSDDDHTVLHRFGETGLATVVDALAIGHEAGGFEREDLVVANRRLEDVLQASAVITGDIHVLKVDVEGAEDQVLRTIDLSRWRPWVLVIEATEPNSTVTTHDRWEPQVLEAGYTFTLFDGLSRFYVSPDHLELVEKLSYPACVLDDFVPAGTHGLQVEVTRLAEIAAHGERTSNHWRGQAVGYWSNAMARVQKSDDRADEARQEAARLRRQLERVRGNLEQARDDRKRLRARVVRLKERVAALEQRGPAPRGVRTRLRSVAQKVARK